MYKVMKKKVFYAYSTNGFANRVYSSVAEFYGENVDKDVEIIDVDNIKGGLLGGIIKFIRDADIFICDITPDIYHCTGEDGRVPGIKCCYSPNVMLEIGSALENRGYENICFIVSQSYSKPEFIPSMLQGIHLKPYNDEETNTARDDVIDIIDNMKKEFDEKNIVVNTDYELSQKAYADLKEIINISPEKYRITVSVKKRCIRIIFAFGDDFLEDIFVDVRKKNFNGDGNCIDLSESKILREELYHIETNIISEYFRNN